jgi:hypothetical protein
MTPLTLKSTQFNEKIVVSHPDAPRQRFILLIELAAVSVAAGAAV